MIDLSHLNPPQRKAVEYIDGPLLVIAGAGSGKTRVIIYRIANLIYNHGVSPENILAVTFTNKAAEEMKERILKLVSSKQLAVNSKMQEVRGHLGSLWIGTFHSICLRLLRRYGQLIGFRNDFYIYDKGDQLSLIKECVKELNINEEQYSVNSIGSRISYMKGRLITPQQFAMQSHGFGMDDKVLKVFRLYEDKLKKNNAMDFDDLIMKCVNLFENNPELLSRYQETFRYILVDEYQDTNPSQYKLIQLLADKHKNLCVVGDDDQSIYRFRGAELKNILSFDHDYPTAMIIRLEQNYRSTGAILDVAGSLIEENSDRRDKKLWTENPSGEPVLFCKVADEREEAKYIVREIKTLLIHGKTPSQFAILYRTNAQSRAIEEVMKESGIPYKIIGGIRFYERKEIKDILAYIRVSLRPDDDVSLRRIINVPPRGIGTTTIKMLEDYSISNGTSMYGSVSQVLTSTPKLGKFYDLVEKLRVLVRELSPSEFVKKIFELTGYIEALRKDENYEDREENVMELLAAVKRFEEKEPNLAGAAISKYLDDVSLLSEDELNHDPGKSPDHAAKNMVSLMTLHSAKGLEFPVVFIAGLEEGTLPHARAFDNVEELEEERRLCYVGITRAREHLYMTAASERNLFGQTQRRRESRFLREIKKSKNVRIEIANKDNYTYGQDFQRKNPSYSYTENKTPYEPIVRRGLTKGDENRRDKNVPPILNTYMDRRGFLTPPEGYSGAPVRHNMNNRTKGRFKSGDRVRHSMWGVGVVEHSEGAGEMEKVTVKFPSEGLKTLVVKYAKLEVI
ncbi:MAG: UvrD-helicase domain-containing protein [Nitrospirae bacterium]|nr:UvrD-helicase domain-containing protein [Nitrospirota bacterium]